MYRRGYRPSSEEFNSTHSTRRVQCRLASILTSSEEESTGNTTRSSRRAVRSSDEPGRLGSDIEYWGDVEASSATPRRAKKTHRSQNNTKGHHHSVKRRENDPRTNSFIRWRAARDDPPAMNVGNSSRGRAKDNINKKRQVRSDEESLTRDWWGTRTDLPPAWSEFFYVPKEVGPSSSFSSSSSSSSNDDDKNASTKKKRSSSSGFRKFLKFIRCG